MGNKLWVQILDAGDMSDPIAKATQALPEGFEGMMAGYRFRSVGNMNELREKVLIFDDGLDDRVIELAKPVIWVSAGTPKGQLFYHSTFGAGSDRRLLFALIQPEGVQQLQVLWGVYEEIACKFAGVLSEELCGYHRIDQAWAQSIYKSAGR